MTKEVKSILKLMSERLKNEPYINNANSKDFLAEIATIIIHILQKDGRYNLQIDDCFKNFKDRVFDYSLKKLEETRNFAFFKDKDDSKIAKVFVDMLDFYFTKKEIETIMQLFDEIETIDDDYLIIFKKKDTSTDSKIITKEKKNDKAFAIDRTTSETEIRQYFNNKIAEGYYADIYKLLVDFTLMMYRKGAHSIDLSLTSFDSTIEYINTLIRKNWIYNLQANELEPNFTYLWKKAEPDIIIKAINALQIPYKTKPDGSIIVTQTNEAPEVLDGNMTTRDVMEDPVEENLQTRNNEDEHKFTLSHIYPDTDVKSKLSELFDVSEKELIEENYLLDEINNLLYLQAWDNVYDLFGDIQYIIYQQMKIANKSINYQTVKLGQFEGKHYYFIRTFHKKIKLDSRQNLRKSFRDIWHSNYAASTIEKMGLQFDLIQSIDNLGNIALKFHQDTEGIGAIITDERPLEQASTSATEEKKQNQNDFPIGTISIDTGEATNETSKSIDEEIEENDEPEVQEEYDEDIVQDEDEVELTINDAPVKISFEFKTRAEKELAEFWDSTFPNGYYDTYIWKNKISTETYDKLKEKIKSCVNDKQKEKGFTKRFAKAIVVYCAEWYKREYNGNDGQGNPLDALGIKQLRTLNLWEWAELDKKLLFGNEYLESIYALGGFPINYITTKKFDDVLKELNSTYNDITSNESAKKKIFDKNKTLQYSLRKENGSLHLLFDYIKDPEHYPIADADFDKDPFNTFIEGIKNYREKWDKFSLDWIVECNEYAPLIRRKIRLKLNPEENGIHNNRIPYYRVEKFKDKKDIDLYLCFNDEDTDNLENREHIHFINTFNGYFVGENVIDYYIFSEIPTIEINQIKVVAKYRSNHDFVYVQIEQIIKPYLQLFETGKYSTYSTKRNQGDSYLLLPFNYPIVKGAINQDASPKYLTENGKKYRFTKIIDQLIIKDFDGKDIPIYSQNNKIEVSIENYSNIFVYPNEKYFTRIVTDESGEETSSPVQLLFRKSDIKYYQYFDVTEPRDLEDYEVIIKFKKENDTFYSDWTEDNQPEQGFIKLRVDVQDRKIPLDIYYIPSNEIPFKRDCISNKIVIDDGVNIVESTSDNLNSNREKYECLFKVGSSNDYVIVPIIKPLNVTELYKDGEFIKEYKNDSEQHIRIPLLFKDKYSLRRYDESGLAYHNLANEDIDILDFMLEDDYSSIDKTIERSTPVGIIDFYLCTAKKYNETSEGYKLNVGENGVKNYRFYFWDLKLEHDPIRINETYDNGLLNLHSKDYPDGIIFQSLEDNVCPRHYCKPILTTHNQKWPSGSESLPSLPACLKCYDIASKHNMPYRVFDPLYWLLKDTDSRLVHFFASLILIHWNDENDEILLTNLVRLSEELYFSWPFLNIMTWRNFKKVCKEYDLKSIAIDAFNHRIINMAERLFVKSGNNLSTNNQLYLEQLTNIYWNNEKANGYAFQSYYDTDVWYTYSQTKGIEYDRGERLESCAIRFMRAKTIRKKSGINKKMKYNKNITIYDNFDDDKRAIVIIGFTDKENKRDRRDIKAICRFLRLLENDDNSYLRILSYFKKNKIIKKTT